MTNIKDLAKSLVDKYGLTLHDAEQFVMEMFDVVIDESRTGKGTNVRIKGLGTFKIVVVSPRASVDVNSGERIMLEGRNKMAFTPESALRDRINAPFAQFQSVVLNDGVDFSDIDDVTAETVEPDKAECISKPATDSTENIVAEADATESSMLSGAEHAETDAQPNKNAYTSNDDVMPEKTEHTGCVDAEKKVADDESNCCHSTTVTDVARNIMCEGNQSSCNRAAVHSDEVNDENPESNTNVLVRDGDCKKHRMRLLYIFIGLALAVSAALCGMYIAERQITDEHDARIGNIEKKIIQSNAADNANVMKHSASVRNTSDTVSEKKKQVAVDVKSEKKQTSDSLSKVAKPSSVNAKISQDYDSDSRIRTGAYIIVGISKTVRIGKGQTFASVCKAYLGEGMECYVEAVNNYRTLREGDEVKIPQLKLKPRRR